MSALVNDRGEKQLKVAIVTPCQDTVAAGYALDLAKLVGRSQLPNIQLALFHVRGTIIPEQRTTLARAARDAGCTHVLWVDSDMRFPANSLIRLLEHDEPIVACNYPTRRPPYLPTAEHKDLGMLFTEENSTGLVEVGHAGMGLMLVDMDVHQKIAEPWFALGYSPSDGGYVGEDFFFCKKAKEAGYRVLIDQDLSKEVKHIGETEFRNEHANVTREMYNKKQEVA